jgi:hypothetical protein
LFQLLRQAMAAMAALGRQYRVGLIDSLRRDQRPVRSVMARLAARLPPAGLAAAPASPRAGFPSQPIGGRRLGGIGRILLPPSQLPLQLGDLFVFLGNLLRRPLGLLGEPLTKLFILAPQALDLPTQRIPVRQLARSLVRSSVRRSQWPLNI